MTRGRKLRVDSTVVETNICGFDVETTLRTSSTSGHLGLFGMCERAMLLGGSVTIKSMPGKGTTVSVQIPFQDRYQPVCKDGQKRCRHEPG
jgi:two-component system, NarL family, sensor histidine kinase NreB